MLQKYVLYEYKIMITKILHTKTKYVIIENKIMITGKL